MSVALACRHGVGGARQLIFVVNDDAVTAADEIGKRRAVVEELQQV
ncbi:hypothetical protein OCK02_23555 [Rhizobium sp. TRM96647]|nr:MULTISPECIES: hypothetical protein [unclassified Rhizobium]MCV3739154.1 hypothetical protein [Rhizobium sp. TRM96647]MCV3760841.1 hypothetical protein [Rhizobium sp. TRM96650]